MDLISVIVPVYNVEKYLERCINSLIKQTYPHLEIILVDDGSTDDSGSICDYYATQYHNVFVIHQENRGQWHARNAGLDMCQGEYIGFVDSDDYIEKDMYEILYRDITEYMADIAGCSSFKEMDGQASHQKFTGKYLEYSSPEKFVFDSFTLQFDIAVWSKLYCKRILSNVRFPELYYGEDVPFLIDATVHAKKIIYHDIGKYHYNLRIGSTTRQFAEDNIENISPKVFDQIEAYKLSLNTAKIYWPMLAEFFESLYWGSLEYVLIKSYHCKALKIYKNKIKEIQKIIIKSIGKIISNRYISLKGKLAYVLLAYNVSLYIYLIKFTKKGDVHE